MGSEDPLHFFFFFFFRAHLFKRIEVEHVLTMANLKLKPSIFALRQTIGDITLYFYVAQSQHLYFHLP